ncbi:hypothetical protein BOTBODRAFT_127226 [Botryobasidium botryosum FD-172 SS1]|uniref:DNA mismatch repair protein PMS1 n=1 Tax=Botryobasidium botryosum (strain FD-172 SS1) TaxID=930990 RepID=A0A067MRZ9_BOTB1|nr:hypothetical protein BOTBODRAFT_127226 [Botryobasidium botryosum FD-172 SS1]
MAPSITLEAGSIMPLDHSSVHRITSGQVVIDLQTAVKELVENSLDAGATNIEVRFKDYGVGSVEVIDNGSGIAAKDYDAIALKHHTSKLAAFEDLTTVRTFGFRGEALSSLCALCDTVTVTTATAEDAPMGTVLEMEKSGRVKSRNGKVARQRGTTIVLTGLFKPLPVRRKEFERNSKREFGKALALLHAYALVPCAQEARGVRLTVTNHPNGGRRTVQLQTDGSASYKASTSALWGPKATEHLVPLDLILEVEAEKSVLKRQSSTGNTTQVLVKGLVSKFSLNCGRTGNDRQFFYVNGRPCNLPKVQKAFNEIYKSFNVAQAPFIIADFQIPTEACDVNVSPDKRTIFLHRESYLIQALKSALEDTFQSSRSTFSVQNLAKESGSSRDSSQSATPDYDPAEQLNQETQDICLPGPNEGAAEGKATERDPGVITADNGDGPEGSSEHPASYPNSEQVVDELADLRTASTPDSPSPATAMDIDMDDSTSRDVESDKEATVVPPATPPPPQSPEPPKSPRGQPGQLFADETPPSSPPPSTTSQAPTAKPVHMVLDTAGASWNRRRGADIDTDAGNTKKKPRLSASGVGGARQLLRHQLAGFARPGSQVAPIAIESDEEQQQDEIIDLDLDTTADLSSRNNDEDETMDDGEEDEVNGTESSLRADCAPRSQPLDQDTDRAADLAKEGSDIGVSSLPRVRYMPGHPLYQETPPPSLRTRVEDDTEEPLRDQDAPDTTEEALAPVEIHRTTGGSDVVLPVDLPRISARWHKTPPDPASPTRGANIKVKVTLRPDAGISNTQDAESAERELSRVIHKDDFQSMVVVGQFNLGFIVARWRKRLDADGAGEEGGEGEADTEVDDLFLIDQHAADEKYNFETLQQTTKIQSQKLFRPRPLELTAADELVAIENAQILRNNGFEISVDEDAPTGQQERVRLVAQPVSKDTVFDMKDLEELLHLMQDQPTGKMVRCSKARSMFAMRACRKSVMIGKALTHAQMTSIIRHMGTMDQPWNCPHGRPTMRHLASLADAKFNPKLRLRLRPNAASPSGTENVDTPSSSATSSADTTTNSNISNTSNTDTIDWGSFASLWI